MTAYVITQRKADEYIRDRLPFRAGGLSAKAGPPQHLSDAGLLPDEWAVKFLRSNATYVVYSYDTPIAWVEEDGTEIMPPARYSLTTSQHQYVCAAGMSLPWRSWETERAVPHNAFGPRHGRRGRGNAW